jgi:circadian clock protein KaiB
VRCSPVRAGERELTSEAYEGEASAAEGHDLSTVVTSQEMSLRSSSDAYTKIIEHSSIRSELAKVGAPLVPLRPGACSVRLYVSASSAASLRAVGVVQSLLRSDDELEVVDVVEHPDRAEADHVLATPTLLKLEPAPRQRVIGDLGDAALLRRTLGLGGSA